MSLNWTNIAKTIKNICCVEGEGDYSMVTRRPHSMVANILDYDIVNKFTLPLCYYVPFQTNTIQKVWAPLYPLHQLIK